MKQYKETSSAPKITVAKPEKKEKDIERQVKDLAAQVAAQQETIDRMHRDIVRLRTSINEVSARIK